MLCQTCKRDRGEVCYLAPNRLIWCIVCNLQYLNKVKDMPQHTPYTNLILVKEYAKELDRDIVLLLNGVIG